jgi:uncharacterized protein (DUF1501 family)
MSEAHSQFKDFDRRAFIRVGGLTLFGTLSLGDIFRMQADAPAVRKKDLNIILLWLSGGLSHLDSFDPKPQASSKYRGIFKPIATNVSGIQISEHLPLMAQRTDKYVIIRSMLSKQSAHEPASAYMLSGHMPLSTVQFSSIGSVICKELGPRNEMPAFVSVPGATGVWEQSGFLGPKYNPFNTGNPNQENFKVRDLDLPMGVDWTRMNRRNSLLTLVNERFRKLDSSGAMDTLLSHQQAALKLMSSPLAKKAFNLEDEPEKLREAYGRTSLGQGCLLARRLVEAGVRIVSVSRGFNTWDHHKDVFNALQNTSLPELDRAAATLLDDLSQRGLLDSTLVLVTGEFGRTPEINVDAGRDHWPNAFSALVAGAGIQGGRVWGATDEIGMYVKDNPVEVPDLIATIYSKLGIDYSKEYMSNIGRPIRILDEKAKPLSFLA